MPRIDKYALAALFLVASAHVAQAQQPRVAAPEHLDSSTIRALPLVRSQEVTSFLPGSIIGLSYGAAFAGSIGGTALRVDDVPAPALQLSSRTLASVDASLFSTSARFSDPAVVFFSTQHTSEARGGYFRVATDKNLPGSVGLARAEAGLRSPLGSRLHFSADFTGQSAQQTEFNNFNVPVYRAGGIDTTITLTPNGDGPTRNVPVLRFEKTDRGDVPASNWNELLANARLEFVQSERSSAFVAGYFSRDQAREPFGGAGVTSLYLPQAQRGERAISSLVTFGLDQVLSHSTLHARLARSSTQTTRGVLNAASTASMDAAGYGLHLSEFQFLVDDKTFPVNDALIAQVLSNGPNQTPFPTTRVDLATAIEYRMNPYGVFGIFPTRGIANGSYTFSDDSRLYASALVENQTGMHNLSIGGEATSYDVRYANVGYIMPSSQIWKEKPRVLAGFATDEISLPGATAEIGVRVDHYDANTSYSPTPGYIDPATLQKAPAKTRVSPRFALSVPGERVAFRAALGRYVRIPDFNSQFDGKNTDFFRYHNTNTQVLFNAGPLELIQITAANVGGEFRVSDHASLTATAFMNQADKVPATSRVPYVDPTNPTSTVYLNIIRSQVSNKERGALVAARYQASSTLLLQGGITYDRYSYGLAGSVDPLGNQDVRDIKQSRTSVVGIVEEKSGRFAGLNETFSLRASSPIDFPPDKSAWIVRADARIAKPIHFAKLHGDIWIDALRFPGSAEFSRWSPDPELFAGQVASQRETIGAGQIRDNIDLTSLATAGPGIRNEVDLYLLQQAEKRFGNGDKNFAASEQVAAFTAAEKLALFAGLPRSQSRRIQIGASINF